MDLEAVKREIIELIDEHYSGWVKAAFYSDPRVSKIMDRLLVAWRENSNVGSPIDYASENELLVLLSEARRYSSMSEATARALALSRMGGDEEGFSVLGVFSAMVKGLFRRRSS